jgi:hypothetical protein
MNRRARGFAGLELLMYAGIALAILAAIGGIIWWADANIETSAGVKRGEANRQALWDKANRDAEQDQRAREARVATSVQAVEAMALASAGAARDADQRWKEKARESNRNQVALGVCTLGRAAEPAGVRGDRPGGAPAVGDTPPATGDSLRLLLTWEFVRQYDGAWTGRDGQPVFGAAARGEGATGAGASPYGLEELRDVAGENARLCSEDRREFASLILKLRAAERSWGARK